MADFLKNEEVAYVRELRLIFNSLILKALVYQYVTRAQNGLGTTLLLIY